jgi:hypothetical protein
MATTTFTPSMLRGAGTRGIPEIPAGGSSLLLDEYGEGAYLAVSMRKLRSDYTGFSMRIQRRGTAGSTGTADDQADLHFDSNNYTSLDSPITAVTAGVLSTTLGEFCAASGYSNPDSMPSADTVEVTKLYNQSVDTTVADFPYSLGYNELVTNGVLETVTIGGDPFVALAVTWREGYSVTTSTTVPITTFNVTNIVDPAGGFTTEAVTLAPSIYNGQNAEIIYDDTTDKFEFKDRTNGIIIISSSGTTFSTDTPYVFSYLLQSSGDLTSYHVNNTLQGSRTDYSPVNANFTRIKYNQLNKASGPEFMEAIYYTSSKQDDISNINQNMMTYYNIS